MGFLLRAADDSSKVIDSSDISVGVFTQAIQNAATLRADNGASMSRLRFAGEEMASQETNLIAARGRITDVDIAAESTRLAKYNILLQASASIFGRGELEHRYRTDASQVKFTDEKKKSLIRKHEKSPSFY